MQWTILRGVFTFRFLAWLGGNELAILLAIAGIAAGIWMFAMIATKLWSGPQAFGPHAALGNEAPGDLAPIGTPGRADAARDITALGGVVVVSLLTVITAGFLALDVKAAWRFFVCGSVFSGLIASTILKDLFVRPRLIWSRVQPTPRARVFPADHSMMSAITYLTLERYWRDRRSANAEGVFLLVAVLLTFMVGVAASILACTGLRTFLAGLGRWRSVGLLCWLAAPVAFRVVARSSGRQNIPQTRLAELCEAEVAYCLDPPSPLNVATRLIATHFAPPPQSRAIFNELCRAGSR